MYRDLTKGSIIRGLLLFALPMIAGNLLQQLYNIADTLIVGQALGRNALAAVGSAYTLMTFLTSIFLGLSMGSGALFSIALGKKDEALLRSAVGHAFGLILAVTVVLNVLVYAFLDAILRFLQIPQELYGQMREYLMIIFAGLLATFLYNFFACLLRAAGNSVAPLCFLGLSAGLNIALDLLFVLRFSWGIAGAAIATVLAQYVSGIGILIYALLKCGEFLPGKADRAFSRAMLAEILDLSLLTCAQQSAMNFGILLIQRLVDSFGPVTMAAFAAAVKIDSFAYLPVQDFGNAFSTFVAQNYGAGMTKDIYMKNLTVLYTAKFYKDFYRENIEITPEELDAYYASHAQDYRSVYYQLFYLSGASSGGMEAAKQHAQELAELHTLEEFEAQCEAYTVYNDDESYWQTASVLRRESCWTAISYLRDWLSGERAYGDTTVAEASNGYYVAFFREESDNDYPTVNLKYFTVSGADANDDIRDYLDAFSKSDGSAQSFFELSDNIRDKDYNRSDNRKISSITYDNATILTVPEDALDWAFDEARQPGDITTIRSEDCWYVLYFDGFGETASRMIADKQLRTERYKEWTAEVQSNISYAEGRYFSKTASR